MCVCVCLHIFNFGYIVLFAFSPILVLLLLFRLLLKYEISNFFFSKFNYIGNVNKYHFFINKSNNSHKIYVKQTYSLLYYCKIYTIFDGIRCSGV